MLNQTFRIIIEPDGKFFHGFVPSLPGCHTWGKTVQDTKRHVREAMELHIESLLAHGETVPIDNSFEAFESIRVDRPTKKKARTRARLYAK